MALPWWLVALFATAFVFYTDDYVVAGVLPEIAAELAVSQARAGQLVTVFSVTVALVAPVAGVVLARVPRRRLFVASLGLFVAANLAGAASPSFGWLVLWRIVAAVAAASATPALFAVALQRAPAGRAGRYVAVVALGVTGSIAAGVPLGTWIGGLFGWRATFLTMAAGGLVAALLVLAVLGRVPGGHPEPIGGRIRVLAAPAVVLCLVANTVLMAGSMMMLTYLAPYLTETAEGSIDQRAVAFGLAGVAGVAGILAGGFATDRWGAARTLAAGVGAIVVSMGALWALWVIRPAPPVAVLSVLAVWGGAAFWNSPAVQARLAGLAGPVATQALALNTSGTYLGVSLGGAGGGVALSLGGPGALPPVAACCGLVALAVLAAASSATAPCDARRRDR